MATSPQAVRRVNTRWTAESVGRLTVDDIKQLRDNAARHQAKDVVALCEQALEAAKGGGAAKGPRASRSRKAKLVPRRNAFQLRGVMLNESMSSWGGVRSTDGTVVMSLWAEDIRQEDGGCRYLLWAPNVNGARPWSDSPGGQERLEHCKRALAAGHAEGLLAYGVRHTGYLPEERATTVSGVDPTVVIAFRVVRQGDEYWAEWGTKPAPSAS